MSSQWIVSFRIGGINGIGRTGRIEGDVTKCKPVRNSPSLWRNRLSKPSGVIYSVSIFSILIMNQIAKIMIFSYFC